MKLILVRHAEAVPLPLDGIASDFHRPLTDHGKLQAAALAKALESRGIRPSVVLTSPLIRALETAEPIAQLLTPGKEYVVTERLSAGEMRPKKLSKLVFEYGGGETILVGHMPDITDYASWLMGSETGSIDFDKAAVACIECKNEIAKGTGTLDWLVTPAWYFTG